MNTKIDQLIKGIDARSAKSPKTKPKEGDKILGTLPEELQCLHHLVGVKGNASEKAAEAAQAAVSPGGELYPMMQSYCTAHAKGTTKASDHARFQEALSGEFSKRSRAFGEYESIKALFWSLVRLEFDQLSDSHLTIGEDWMVIERASSVSPEIVMVETSVSISPELAKMLSGAVA